MDKTDPRAALNHHGFTPTRSLGQNFLFDRQILAAVADCAGLSPGDRVLEVGAGAGTLTRELARRGARILALEVDEALRPVLEDTLAGYPQVQVLFTDAARVDWRRLWQDQLAGEGFSIVSNLPYYLTTELLLAWLTSGLPLRTVTVMVQQEAAGRILAGPGTKQYGVLPALVAWYARARVALSVPGSAFQPPAVDSSVLHLEMIDQPGGPSRAALLRVLRAAFGQRRKQVANALSSGLGLPREAVLGLLERTGLDASARAQDLTPGQLAALALTWEEAYS